MISDFGPNPTNATENQMTQFECYGSGIPLPTFSIKKVNATARKKFHFSVTSKYLTWFFERAEALLNSNIYVQCTS